MSKFKVKKDDHFFDRKRRSLLRATQDSTEGIDLVHMECFFGNGTSGVVLVPKSRLEECDFLGNTTADLARILFGSKLT
jgi:hypothetical protein